MRAPDYHDFDDEDLILDNNVSYKPINYSEIYDFYEDKKVGSKATVTTLKFFLKQ